MNNDTKKYIKHKNNKKFKKLTRKIGHKGGGKKELFEVQSLSNFDFDKISLSKTINANIEWGIMPGPPPKPDCTIL
jgi:hypothetical protein